MIRLLNIRREGARLPFLLKSSAFSPKKRFYNFSDVKVPHEEKNDQMTKASFHINEEIKQAESEKDKILKKTLESHFSKNERKYNFQILKHLKAYVLPFNNPNDTIKKNVREAYFWLFLSKVCFFGIPFCLKYGVNALADPTTIHYAVWIFLGYGIFSSVLVLAEGIKMKAISKIALEAWRISSVKSFLHLLNMDVSFHYSSSQKARLFSLYKAQQFVEKNIKISLNMFIPLLFDLMFSVGYLHIYCGPEFVGTFLMTIGLYMWFTARSSFKRRPFIMMQKSLDKKADSLMNEALANIYNVKYFNAEKREVARYDKLLEKYIDYNIQNIETLGNLNLGQRVIFSAGMTLNLILGVYKVQAGALTTGDIVLLQTLMLQFMGLLNNLGVTMREFSESFVEMRELFKLLEKKPVIRDSETAKDLELKGGEIKFKNISFGYQEDKLVIKNLTLDVRPGEFVSIVGESGIGKSSLFYLLFRLFDPREGNILIDEQELRNLKLESLRQNIAIVSQNTILFNDSIFNNIIYSNPDKTREDVEKLCKDLNLHDYIMSLPQKYDTKVGEQGAKFSGGERQRISIARSLLKDSPILLVDEATSALDPINETAVMNLLKSYKGKKTILMITHRLHLNTYPDRVIALTKSGKLESGLHDDLIKDRDSVYYSLWQTFLSEINNSEQGLKNSEKNENTEKEESIIQ